MLQDFVHRLIELHQYFHNCLLGSSSSGARICDIDGFQEQQLTNHSSLVSQTIRPIRLKLMLYETIRNDNF